MADRFFITLEDDTLFDVQYYAAHERSFSKVYWTENKSAATSFACEALAQSVLSEIKKIAAKSRCSDSATISILKESGAVQNKAEPKPPEPEPPPETHERESAPRFQARSAAAVQTSGGAFRGRTSDEDYSGRFRIRLSYRRRSDVQLRQQR